MGLSTDMKNLTEDLLTSFRQRITDNEELVNDVQKTLDGFRKDHQELASVLNANAAAQRKGRANDEKQRMNAFGGLMNGIHQTIASIENEVVAIKSSTMKMTSQFSDERAGMAEEMNKSFGQNRLDRAKEEKGRMNEFDALMKNINSDIRSINDEVSTIFKSTEDLLAGFENEHLEMSEELKQKLGQNLSERTKYTGALLKGFQKRLSEISRENQKMAQNLRKDLANGEAGRISHYTGLMKGINVSIKEIRNEVSNIQKSTSGMLKDLLQNRVQAATEWDKMHDAMARIRKEGTGSKPEASVKKAAKTEAKKPVKLQAKPASKPEVKKNAKVEVKIAAPVKKAKKTPVTKEMKTNVTDTAGTMVMAEQKPKPLLTLEEKVLDYINNHPQGVRISEMEEPMGETRMKLGFIAKNLLDEGKVLKIDTIYYPKTRQL